MIPTFDYRRTLPEIEADVRAAIARVLASGQLLLGPETAPFEAEFAAYVGARECVAVASGTAALTVALLALGIGAGDEVITVANTCVPTVAGIRQTGATPVFVDVRDEDLMMDPEEVQRATTARTRCILPVHLWGWSADLDALASIAADGGVYLVEDCAQAHGTTYTGRHVGTWGQFGCFSFYPTKNVGAFGDAGALVTDDAALAETARRLRVYGYDDAGIAQAEGLNARISELQAAILRVKLRAFPEWLTRRRAHAARYDAALDSCAFRLPPADERVAPSYHQYVVRCRDRAAVETALRKADIGYGIHYPTPVHLMPPYRPFRDRPLPVTERAAGEILSLPVYEGLTAEEVDHVIAALSTVAA